MEHNAIYRLVAMQQMRDQKLRVTSWHETSKDAQFMANWIVRNGGSVDSISQWEKTNWEPIIERESNGKVSC